MRKLRPEQYLVVTTTEFQVRQFVEGTKLIKDVSGEGRYLNSVIVLQNLNWLVQEDFGGWTPCSISCLQLCLDFGTVSGRTLKTHIWSICFCFLLNGKIVFLIKVLYRFFCCLIYYCHINFILNLFSKLYIGFPNIWAVFYWFVTTLSNNACLSIFNLQQN